MYIADRHVYDRNYVAIITPFKKDSLEIDYDAFRKLIHWYTDDPEFAKLRGAFIVNPEASEMFYFSREEKNKLVDIMMEEVGGKMPVFAGVFGVTVADAIQCAQDAKDRGVDGLFIFPPTGTMEVSTARDDIKYPEVWSDWVQAIDEAIDLPIILHPAAIYTNEWGQSLPASCLEYMFDRTENIVGYKVINGIDSACMKTARFIRSYESKRHVAILNGGCLSWLVDELLGLVDGSVQGSWNWDKDAYYQVAEAMEKNDLRATGEVLGRAIIPLWEYVYAGGTRIHVRYKLAAWIRGVISHPFMIPPMGPPHRDEAEYLYELISKSGMSCISKEEFEETWAKKDQIIGSYIKKAQKDGVNNK